MYSEPILRQIEALQRVKSSEWRNRTISHLKNAYACAVLLERGIGDHDDRQIFEAAGIVNNFTSVTAIDSLNCKCPIGARDKSCVATIHKS